MPNTENVKTRTSGDWEYFDIPSDNYQGIWTADFKENGGDLTAWMDGTASIARTDCLAPFNARAYLLYFFIDGELIAGLDLVLNNLSTTLMSVQMLQWAQRRAEHPWGREQSYVGAVKKLSDHRETLYKGGYLFIDRFEVKRSHRCQGLGERIAHMTRHILTNSQVSFINPANCDNIKFIVCGPASTRLASGNTWSNKVLGKMVSDGFTGETIT